MQEQKWSVHLVVPNDLGLFLAAAFCRHALDWNQVNFFASQLRPDAPTLDVGEISLRNTELHRSYGPAERTRKHEETRENNADNQTVGATQAIFRQGIREHHAEDTAVKS